LLSITDVTGPAAVIVALFAASASRRSAVVALRVLNLILIQETSPRLTDASGGSAKIALDDGCLTFWLTNVGQSGLAIERVDLVSQAEMTTLDWLLYPRGWRMRYWRCEYRPETTKPFLRGNGPDDGTNVSEVNIQLDDRTQWLGYQRWGSSPRAPHLWGRITDAPHPAEAILNGHTDRTNMNVEIAIEIWTKAHLSGMIDRHTVQISAHNVGSIVKPRFVGSLKRGSIVLKEIS
jgi:hypothetical protein